MQLIFKHEAFSERKTEERIFCWGLLHTFEHKSKYRGRINPLSQKRGNPPILNAKHTDLINFNFTLLEEGFSETTNEN